MIDKTVLSDALLQYADETWGWDSWSEFTNYYDNQRGTVFAVKGVGDVILFDFFDVDIDKNYDGWSEERWIIFLFDNTLYRISGSHTSYEGTTWENEMEIVVPKEKVVTVYEAQ